MFELPTTVTVSGKEYNIRNKGDYRVILDCFEALNDEELDPHCRVLTALIIFYADISDIEDLNTVFGENIEEAYKQMSLFFTCGTPSVGAVTSHSVVDWVDDAQLIAGAVNAVARMEVRALEYLHWWTFMGYYLNISDSAFTTVVNIRQKIAKHKPLDTYEKEFKRDNPQYFMVKKSKEEIEMEDYLRDLWGGNDNG